MCNSSTVTTIFSFLFISLLSLTNLHLNFISYFLLFYCFKRLNHVVYINIYLHDLFQSFIPVTARATVNRFLPVILTVFTVPFLALALLALFEYSVAAPREYNNTYTHTSVRIAKESIVRLSYSGFGSDSRHLALLAHPPSPWLIPLLHLTFLLLMQHTTNALIRWASAVATHQQPPTRRISSTRCQHASCSSNNK